MILVDTSIWIDHLHHSEPALVTLLRDASVCIHPMIIGELALGTLRDRSSFLALLADLPSTPEASSAEVLHFIETNALFGVGLSLVDAHLLAAVRLSARDHLWTRDSRLRAAADALGVSADLPS